MDLTIPYIPQLNGKAERLNRILLEKTRALLEESGIKKEIWREAAYIATYLLNINPTKQLDVTLYEIWSGKEPDMCTLKLFGCVAHAKILRPLYNLDNRNRKLFFVGCSPKEYRLWNAENRKIIYSRNVKIEEKLKLEQWKILLRLPRPVPADVFIIRYVVGGKLADGRRSSPRTLLRVVYYYESHLRLEKAVELVGHTFDKSDYSRIPVFILYCVCVIKVLVVFLE